MKNLSPLDGKFFMENLVIYCFESQSQMTCYGLFRDFLKQCANDICNVNNINPAVFTPFVEVFFLKKNVESLFIKIAF
jgi:hypothetical protein